MKYHYSAFFTLAAFFTLQSNLKPLHQNTASDKTKNLITLHLLAECQKTNNPRIKLIFKTLNQLNSNQESAIFLKKVGGGPIGCAIGIFAGKFISLVICHGCIAAVSGGISFINPQIGYGVGMALETMGKGVIHSVTNQAALTGGIFLGTLTGPI